MKDYSTIERGELIEEIERLRAEVERLTDELGRTISDVDCRVIENGRLRMALKKYADPNYNGYNGGPEHARAALEGKA